MKAVTLVSWVMGQASPGCSPDLSAVPAPASGALSLRLQCPCTARIIAHLNVIDQNLAGGVWLSHPWPARAFQDRAMVFLNSMLPSQRALWSACLFLMISCRVTCWRFSAPNEDSCKLQDGRCHGVGCAKARQSGWDVPQGRSSIRFVTVVSSRLLQKTFEYLFESFERPSGTQTPAPRLQVRAAAYHFRSMQWTSEAIKQASRLVNSIDRLKKFLTSRQR